ncbi:hypothetical protein HRE53_30835 (plasmid) [Acaryochloris sp. 'Moss Beach']|uniref:hypothetical protein n=1 Tax=Acaryochloris sp. 'Moss Beach' TaxID=2740837 RepID=UPI001F4124B6|nr:hypothetical protein [Acaryochloris sp. 'Moss Beach']UJB73111.1 hypothetical protein HRE53_30835 [Acaryochloris sp. 'Moss Beach']
MNDSGAADVGQSIFEEISESREEPIAASPRIEIKKVEVESTTKRNGQLFGVKENVRFAVPNCDLLTLTEIDWDELSVWADGTIKHYLKLRNPELTPLFQRDNKKKKFKPASTQSPCSLAERYPCYVELKEARGNMLYVHSKLPNLDRLWKNTFWYCWAEDVNRVEAGLKKK